MAQSTVTVTPPNPTPPTNFSYVGATPPTDPAQAQVDDGTAGPLTAFAVKLAAAGTGTSVDAEGRGTEVVVTAPGSRAECPTQSVSDLGNYTSTPNGQHASSLTPSAAPSITALVPQNVASGGGTQALTVQGTGFTTHSVVYVNGVAQTTTYTSSQQVNVAAAPKKATAGNLPVTVLTDGVTTTATNWVFT
jgi:IPT/TIG domain-containing protein